MDYRRRARHHLLLSVRSRAQLDLPDCALPDSISPSSHSHPDVLSFFLSFPRIVLLGRFLTLSSLVLNPLTSFLCRLSGCGRGCANDFPRVALWLLRYFFGSDPTSPGLGFSHLHCNLGESFPLFRILEAFIILTLTITFVSHTHPPIGSAEVGLFKGRRSAGAITLTVITESLSHQDKPAELLSLLALSSRVRWATSSPLLIPSLPHSLTQHSVVFHTTFRLALGSLTHPQLAQACATDS